MIPAYEFIRRPRVLCSIAMVLGFGVYVQALGYGFVYDDIPLIVENTLLRDLTNLPKLLLMEDTIGQYSTGYYRPFVYLVDLLFYQTFGPVPLIYHLMNIFYHMTVIALVFVLTKRVTGSAGSAFVGSLFMALHPVNTESVTFITGKNNIQCAILILLSVLAYLKYKDTGGLKWAVFSAFAYSLALLTKEYSLFLPFVLLAYFMVTRQYRRPDLVSFFISMGLAFCYLLVRSSVLSGMGVELSVSEMPARVFGSFGILASYMRLTVIPVYQKALYPFTEGSLLLNITGILLTSALFLYAWRKRQDQWVVFSIFWYIGFLTPVSNVIPLSGAPMAERSMYVAMIGAGVAAGGIYEGYLKGRLGRAVIASALILFAVLTVMRNPVWKDNRTLYTHMALTAPQSYKGFYNLGNLYFEAGEYEKASNMWELTLKKKPDMMAVYNNLGVAYERAGDYQMAEQYYRKLLDGHSNSTVHLNLAKVLVKQGRPDEAAKSFDAAMEAGDDSDELYMAYSEIFESRGDPGGALEMLLSVSERKGGAWRLLNRAGAIEGARGRLSEAERFFLEALRLNPDCQECSFNLELIKKLKAR